MTGNNILLEMRGICKNFPGVKALDDVQFSLRPGEVHILLGENGAGKSTLMKVLAGAYVPDSGEVLIDGKKVEQFNPQISKKLGVGTIYQEFNLVPYLSVAQNLFLDHMPVRWGNLVLDHKKMHQEAADLLKSLNMNVDTHVEAHELSTAQQQMVEVAKTLTYQSKIIIMDEPTASLTDREIEQLFRTIRELKGRGIGIVYISHRLQELAEIGDRVTVLRDGKYIGTHSMAETSIDDLVTMMVGREISFLFKRDYQPKGQEVLSVKDLSSKSTGLKNVSINLHRGEIVGLAGLVGSGRTELARAIYQADPYEQGDITLFGKPLRKGTPNSAVNQGVSLIPEDRKRQGLAIILSVAENIVMSSLGRLFPLGYITKRKEEAIVSKFIKELRIMTPSSSQLTQYLSGGNQQKVVLAKWLCTEAEIFIFDEPTRGIDVGAKAEIHGFMNELVKEGKAVLMISSELPEILGMSDRIYVMREGEVVAEIPHGEATQENVISYAMAAAEAAA